MSQTPKGGYPDAAPNVVLSVNGVNNRISSANWVYNGNGNTTRMLVVGGGYADMTHDVDNRMVTWTGPASSNPEMYGYLADNKRVWKKTPAGVETYYLYGVGGQKLMTCGIVASPFSLVCTMTHVYFGGKVIRADGAAVVQDRLGSVVARGGDYTAGTFTKRDYFPYGDEIGTASAGNVDKFGTYMRDQTTGLDYADQRYFAGTLGGRFLTADPIGSGLNHYGYVGGDPVNFADPSGLITIDPTFQCVNMNWYFGDVNSCFQNPSSSGQNGGPGCATTDYALPQCNPAPGPGPSAQTATGGGSPVVTSSFQPICFPGTDECVTVAAADGSNVITNPLALVPDMLAGLMAQQAAEAAQGLTVLPQVFFGGFVNLLLNDQPIQGTAQIAGSLAVAVGPRAIAQALTPSTIYHFTSAEAAASINATGGIYPGGGMFGPGVYGSAWNSPTIARIMGANSTEAVFAIPTGLGVAPSGFFGAGWVVPGAYRIVVPLTIFGGVVP